MTSNYVWQQRMRRGGPRAPAEEASVHLNHSWLDVLYVALAVWAGVCVPRNWITVFNLAA